MGYVALGLTWDCETCDLDLHAKRESGAGIIYYARPISDDGTKLIKDTTTNPKIPYGHEYIDFGHQLVDLQQLQITVHFQRGEVTPPGPAKFNLKLAFKSADKTKEVAVEKMFQFSKNVIGDGVNAEWGAGPSWLPITQQMLGLSQSGEVR